MGAADGPQDCRRKKKSHKPHREANAMQVGNVKQKTPLDAVRCGPRCLTRKGEIPWVNGKESVSRDKQDTPLTLVGVKIFISMKLKRL